jgi:ABC-2 type transport system permease protein
MFGRIPPNAVRFCLCFAACAALSALQPGFAVAPLAPISTLQGILVFVIALVAGFRPMVGVSLLAALAFMFLISLLFTALGTAVASVLEDMQGFQLIMNFLIMPLFFLSGALFPLDSAPAVLAMIARFDPLSYGVDGLRGALVGASHFGLLYDGVLMTVVTLILLWVGSILFKRIQI